MGGPQRGSGRIRDEKNTSHTHRVTILFTSVIFGFIFWFGQYSAAKWVRRTKTCGKVSFRTKYMSMVHRWMVKLYTLCGEEVFWGLNKPRGAAEGDRIRRNNKTESIHEETSRIRLQKRQVWDLQSTDLGRSRSCGLSQWVAGLLIPTFRRNSLRHQGLRNPRTLP